MNTRGSQRSQTNRRLQPQPAQAINTPSDTSMTATPADIARLRQRIPNRRPEGKASNNHSVFPWVNVRMPATSSASNGLNTIPPTMSRRMILDIFSALAHKNFLHIAWAAARYW